MAKKNKIVSGRAQLKEIIGRCAVLIALLAGQLFLWRAVAAAAEDLHQKQSHQEQIREVRRRNEEIQKSKETQKELLDQLRVVVPVEDTLLTVIERLQIMAALDQHNVALTLQGIERETVGEEESEPQAITPFKINVVATGKISNLLSYLHRVEHLQELTVVRDVTLVPLAGGTLPTSTATPLPSPGILPSGSPSPSPAVTEPSYTMTLSIVFFFQPLSNATEE